MAQFNIDIPGVGTVTVDGNFATEDSINRLASAMGGSRSTSSNTTLKDINRYGDDVADSLHALDPALRQNKKEVDKNNKNLNQFNNGFSKANGLLGDMSDPGSGTLTKFVKTIGEAGAGILNIIPGIGSVLSGALGAFTGLITEAISFAQGLVDINKDIHNAGIGFITGIEGMQDAATEAGIPFQQFAKAMIENTDSLRLMAGGAPGGILNVSKAMSKLTKSTDQQFQTLLAMGYSVEDIMGTMSDLGAQAGLVGQSLNADQLAKSTTEYLKSQQELNRLTGIDIKQARERMKEQNASLFIQRQLNRITDPAQRAAANDYLTRVPDAIKDFVTSGINFTETSGIITAQLPLLSGGFRDLYKGIESGAIKQDEVDNYLAEMLKNPALKAEMDNMVNVLGITPAELLSKLPISEFEKIRIMTEQGFKAAQSNVNYNDFVLDGMNKSVASMEDLLRSVNNGFSTLGFTLFSLVDGQLAKAGDAAGSVVDRFTNVADALKDYSQARERRIEAEKDGNTELLRELYVKEREAKDKLTKLTGNAAGSISDTISEIPGMIKTFIEKSLELFGQLKTIIADGIAEGFGQKLYDIGLGDQTLSEQQLKELATKEMEKAISEQNFEKIVGLLQENQKRDNPISDITSLAEKAGVKQVNPYEGNWMYDWGLISPPDFMKKGYFTNPWKPQALGGIFDYKPGGEKITVAEAGPELVAPAKRTREGKLGLEVSGAHLDNSQLLRSLVEISKGQADLMASLNGKFDKLVSEQRQANRLSS